MRRRAQCIYLTLNDKDKVDFKRLTEAMEKKMKPEQERLVNKLAFRQRRRTKGESLVDIATNLRQMAARAYPGDFRLLGRGNTGSIHYRVRHARAANGY